MLLWVLLLAVVVPEPALRVVNTDSAGCIRTVELEGVALTGAAPGLCVRQALMATLDDERQVVLLVEVKERLRVFVYRVSGRRLVPRFLGTGFASLRITGATAQGEGLQLTAQDAQGMDVALHCRFQGFPLVCQDNEEMP